MARDGSGTYNLSANAVVASHAQLNSTYFNAALVDIASALTQSISKDGQTTITGNQPMGTNRHTNVGAATARTDYARTAEAQDDTYNHGVTAGGTPTALTISVSPSIAAYASGQRFTFGIGTACTGAATLAVNGLVAKPIVYPRWGINEVIEVVYWAGQFYQIGGKREIPEGSAMLFRAVTAPTGWTQQTDLNDSMLRLVSGAGGGVGGNWVIGGMSNETAGHTHDVTGSTGTPSALTNTLGGGGGPMSSNTHTHAISLTTGAQSATHTHFGDGAWRPLYLNVIFCTKNIGV